MRGASGSSSQAPCLTGHSSGTSTGMALGPRSAAGLCCASRAKHHPGSGPSARTLGSAARQSIEPAKYIEPGARERPKPECHAGRGELSGRFGE